MGDVSYVEMGQSPPSEFVSDRPGSGMPFLQGNAEFTDRFPRPRLWCARPKKIANARDILISVRAPVGAINRADQDYCIGRGLAAVRFTGIDPGFGYHALAKFSAALNRVAQGTTFDAISGEDLRRLTLPVCQRREQRRIAEILDTADEAVLDTEQLIAKLERMKQGLLCDLFTRGIDENGELRDPELHPEDFKDSAAGRIPSDWHIEPFATRCASSAFGPRFSSDLYTPDGAVATLRTSDMDDEGNITLETMPRAAIVPNAMASHLLVRGDLLISRSGTCGIAAVFPGYEMPVVPGAFLIRFRLHDRVFADFFRRYFNSAVGRPRLDRLAVGGVQKNIKGSEVLALGVPVCSPVEAARIVEVTESIDGRVRDEYAELNKLRSITAGLMQDLLTGRVRVTKLLEGDAA